MDEAKPILAIGDPDMFLPRISAAEYQKIAWILVDQHGPDALELAGNAIVEMRQQGDTQRSHAWEVLQSVIGDALQGNLPKAKTITLH